MGEGSTELKTEWEQKKKVLSTLKSNFQALTQEKGNLSRELLSLHDEIKSHLQRVRRLKGERDALTKEVKNLKGERDKFNLEMKSKAEEKKKVDQKKKEVMGEFGFKDDPIKIKLQIEALERKLETEVMPFSKEKELNKKIKELKVRFKEMEKLGTVFQEVRSASKDFSTVRHKAEDLHQQVQQRAQLSQAKHEELNKIFEEVKQLREQEKPLLEKEAQLRVKFESGKKELDTVQARVNELNKIFREEEEKSFQQIAQEKTAEVKEKLRKRKKLSTEDILAFQAIKE